MQRQNFNHAQAGLLARAVCRQTAALALGDLTPVQAGSGLKTALKKGVLRAVALLGRPDGLLGNPKVRMGLSGFLENTSKRLRNFSQCSRVDE